MAKDIEQRTGNHSVGKNTLEDSVDFEGEVDAYFSALDHVFFLSANSRLDSTTTLCHQAVRNEELKIGCFHELSRRGAARVVAEEHRIRKCLSPAPYPRRSIGFPNLGSYQAGLARDFATVLVELFDVGNACGDVARVTVHVLEFASGEYPMSQAADCQGSFTPLNVPPALLYRSNCLELTLPRCSRSSCVPWTAQHETLNPIWRIAFPLIGAIIRSASWRATSSELSEPTLCRVGQSQGRTMQRKTILSCENRT